MATELLWGFAQGRSQPHSWGYRRHALIYRRYAAQTTEDEGTQLTQ